MGRAAADDSDAVQPATDVVAAVRSQLLADLERWETELARYSLTRLTLWAGVYAKAFRSFEVLVVCAAAHWMGAAGKPGQKVGADVARGRSADRLTVGQRVGILRRLDALGLVDKQDHDRWQTDLGLLDRLVKKRNDFAHGRFGYEDRDVATTRALFTDLRALCDSPIISFYPTSRDHLPAK
jgi:hypothetical protein